jgi:hypothetical protein
MYPVEIKLSNISEVRMGSPYNMCDIEIISAANFQLPKKVDGKINMHGAKILKNLL